MINPLPITRLSDYSPWPFTLERTDLHFDLDPDATIVTSQLSLRPRGQEDLVLNGGNLETLEIMINGAPVPQEHVTQSAETLTIAATALPDAPFTFGARVRINPRANTTCEGLYLSGGVFSTQCEAEGFRFITWYPDRPDVMVPFNVTIAGGGPVTLSNGNPADAKAAQCGTARDWRDPWPKPCYLFALVSGDLVARSDSFTTRSGREVALHVWVRPDDLDQTEFAMKALKASMAWDERVYGREYDLDVFNIVAVDDFNMGAMENKGLNIFNSKLVLAAPQTATDLDYERIEAVIAHEYFHNWTGNRITCRDWFQLCLKEGLTVYRDQQFTSDMRSAAVKRIEDVQRLRAAQFTEDAGPLAHPPRPSEYSEINNFYTATVYEKGAEIVGMLHRLVGDDGYRQALDLYFDRHDGQACTIEDWLSVFEDATGRDLSQFKRWYVEAGTPEITMREDWSSDTLTVTLSQKVPQGGPRVIPFAMGLIGTDGAEIVPTRLIEMTEASHTLTFDNLAARPVVSALRGFSTPVRLIRDIDAATQSFLLAHDADPFARWEAGHDLALSVRTAEARNAADTVIIPSPDREALITALGRLLNNDADPAFVALCLRLPGDSEVAAALASQGHVPDPDAIRAGRLDLAHALARAHEDRLAEIYDQTASNAPYTPDAESAGRRTLRLTALSLLSYLDDGTRAHRLYAGADNMTERQGALSCLIRAGDAADELADFAQRFADNKLVIDKWFGLQVSLSAPDRAIKVAEELAARDDFDWHNPNRFRSLIGGLAANHAAFHRADGAGYDFVAGWMGRMDPINPQIAARISGVFETWTRYDAARQAHANAALGRLSAQAGLSRNTAEMLRRMRPGT